MLAQFAGQFHKERGSARVDVVFRDTGVDVDAIQTTVFTETTGAEIVLVQFGDGHAVYAPIEEITQLVVREDVAKDTPGFSVGNARTAVD
jgi:hypothetical protein